MVYGRRMEEMGGGKMSAAVKHLLSAVSVIVIIALIPIAIVTAGKAYRDKERSSSEVRIGISLAPVTMDPHHASDIGSAEYLNLCHGCLYSMYDGNKVEPELAEGYDLSEDGCTYTFHLRDNIYYHDGTPITAYDFVYSWQRLADPETRSTAVYNLTECMSLKNAESSLRSFSECRLPTAAHLLWNLTSHAHTCYHL